MATIAYRAGLTSTTDGTSFATGSHTPAAGELAIILGVKTDSTNQGTVSDSVGGTYTFVRSETKNGGLDTLFCFIGTALVAATERTLTYDCTGDAATGCSLVVLYASPMTRKGLAAIRQSAGQSDQAAAGTPAPAFAVITSVDNPILGVVGNADNPAALTPPTGWTERDDVGYATPTTGLESVSRNSGFAGTTITWGSTSASAFGDIVVELETLAPQPIFRDTFIGTAGVDLVAHVPDTVGLSWVAEEETDAAAIQEIDASGRIDSTAVSADNRHIYTCRPNPTATVGYDVTGTVSAVQASGVTNPWCLVARLTDTSNYYGAHVYGGDAAATMRLYKKVAGVVTQLATVTQAAAANDVFKLEVRANSQKLYQNGVERLSASDGALTDVGRAGFGLGNLFVATDDIQTSWDTTEFRVDEFIPPVIPRADYSAFPKPNIREAVLRGEM